MPLLFATLRRSAGPSRTRGFHDPGGRNGRCGPGRARDPDRPIISRKKGSTMTLHKLSPALFALALAGCGSDPVTTESTFATDSAAQAAAAGLSHGEYVARLGNCVACHSTPEGAPLAGGLKMAVPLLGNIYATNITPDPQTGIGGYSFEEFDRVMR